MPLNPDATDPLIEVIENLASPDLHRAAWEKCCGKTWYFGNASNADEAGRFWKMDLDGDPVFDAIWNASRARCEELAGVKLRVVRQYANGHTYGLGGAPHMDDTRPGTFTLLYYPMQEWKPEWDGETVYLDAAGDVFFAVRPKPNRAVFFDSTILHAGRAPSRSCHALRITVAFKLESVPADEASPVIATLPTPTRENPAPEELGRDGLQAVYRLSLPAAMVDQEVNARLEKLGESVRLPGYPPGKIPASVLMQRYGAEARSEAIDRLAAQATVQALGSRFIVSGLQLEQADPNGDVRFLVQGLQPSDIPEPDVAAARLERLLAPQADLQEILDQEFSIQILDWLDSHCRIPVMPAVVQRELTALRQSAPGVDDAELRALAERRVSLGLLVVELARRWGLSSATSADLEAQVRSRIASLAQVTEREATAAELLELCGE